MGNIKTYRRIKWTAFAVILMIAAVGYWQLRGVLSVEYVAEREEDLRDWQQDAPLTVGLIALVSYSVAAGLSLPIATGMTLICGWYFGFWWGLLIASFGSTAGATIAFLICRYLFRDWAQKALGNRLRAVNVALERDGAFYLFTLRLVPVVAPYFIINAVMGLTRMSAVTFWWVSQLGMLPNTAVYVYAGSTIPTAGELAEEGFATVMDWQLLLALTLLAVFPLAAKLAANRFIAVAALDRKTKD